MRWRSMRNILPLVLAVAGFAAMLAATCDYVLNVSGYDTYIFIAGLAAMIAGYVLTIKAAKESDAGESASGRRR